MGTGKYCRRQKKKPPARMYRQEVEIWADNWKATSLQKDVNLSF